MVMKRRGAMMTKMFVKKAFLMDAQVQRASFTSFSIPDEVESVGEAGDVVAASTDFSISGNISSELSGDCGSSGEEQGVGGIGIV